MIPWTLDAELRRHLRCPVSGGPLVDRPRGLYSPAADLLFPVVDGVPWLVRECALAPLPEERGDRSP